MHSFLQATTPASSLARPRAAARAQPPPCARAAPPPPVQPVDLWDDAAAPEAAAAAARAAARPKPPARRPDAPPPLRVCAPGASYNPPEAARQELVAAAVAVEYAKQLRAELKPPRPPLLGAPVAALMEAEMLYAAEEAPAEEEEAGAAGGGGAEEDAGAGVGGGKRPRPLTRADRARKRRAKDTRASEEAGREAKKQRRDLSTLPSLNLQLAATAASSAERAQRRAVARAERSKAEPVRLGRVRYVAAPIAVPLENETGSLRRVVPVSTLLSDRYNALQRAELIEPRRAAKYVRSKAYSAYTPGARGGKELEMHAAVAEARRAGAAEHAVVPS